MLYTNGNLYNGIWRHDKRVGFGKMTYANGDEYSGPWTPSGRHGSGVLSLANGPKVHGNFCDDSLKGVAWVRFPGGKTKLVDFV